MSERIQLPMLTPHTSRLPLRLFSHRRLPSRSQSTPQRGFRVSLRPRRCLWRLALKAKNFRYAIGIQVHRLKKEAGKAVGPTQKEIRRVVTRRSRKEAINLHGIYVSART